MTSEINRSNSDIYFKALDSR